MKWMMLVIGLATLMIVQTGCQSKGGKLAGPTEIPDEKPGDFAVLLVSTAYPTPAPNLRIMLWADGTGSYSITFREPNPGSSQGPFRIDPAHVDEVYATVQATEFFKLKSEYIADPPIPGRGVDILRITAGGLDYEVRSEYAEVEQMDAIRGALLKVIPPEAYAGLTVSGEKRRCFVDKRSKLIHIEDGPGADEVPEDQRIYFANIYEALDAGYHPAETARPFER